MGETQPNLWKEDFNIVIGTNLNLIKIYFYA